MLGTHMCLFMFLMFLLYLKNSIWCSWCSCCIQSTHFVFTNVLDVLVVFKSTLFVFTDVLVVFKALPSSLSMFLLYTKHSRKKMGQRHIAVSERHVKKKNIFCILCVNLAKLHYISTWCEKRKRYWAELKLNQKYSSPNKPKTSKL